MGVYIGTTKYTGGPADPSSSMISKSIGTAAGDMIYFSASATPVRLPIGSNGQVLTLSNGVPSWQTPSGGGGGSSTLSGLNDVSISSASSGQSLVFNGTSWVNSFNSAGFNQVTAVFDTSGPLQGYSIYRANCGGNKRNFINMSLSSSQFAHDEEVVVYLENAVPFTDNYILISNGTGQSQIWCSDALHIFDSSSNHISDFILLPADSSGSSVREIPVGYSLWGAVNVGFGGGNNAAMLTFGGRFNEV